MKFKKENVKRKKSSVKKQSAIQVKKVLEPIEFVIQQLNFQPINFEVGNSGKCFYCTGALPNCGCVLLKLGRELEGLSKDFERLSEKYTKGWLGIKVDSYTVFNLKMWPQDEANVLAYNVKENCLLYKRYRTGTFWPVYSGFGAVSEGEWNSEVEIIGVELDFALYNGLCLTGDSYGTAELSREPNYIAPVTPMPKTTRRAFELVNTQQRIKSKHAA